MNIKYLFLDVDGTLTDGKIYMSSTGELFKVFDVKDGLALSKLTRKYNIVPIIITSRNSKIVELRCKELCIDHIIQGVEDKLDTIKKIIGELNIDIKNIAYMGDDLNDFEAITFIASNNGYTACPSNSADLIKNNVHFICKSMGGDGAVREFIEHLINICEFANN